jgi:hypothetical protein
MMRKILNFALFQAGWFACILGAAHGMPVAAFAAACAVIGVNLWQFSKDRMSDLRLLFTVALIGFCLDSANLSFGVFSLIGDPHFPHLCPLWLVALWAMLATILRESLSWLAGRYGLAALLGAIAGPLSYLGGVKLGAATMNPNRAFSIAALATGWAVAMPILIFLAHGNLQRAEKSKEEPR